MIISILTFGFSLCLVLIMTVKLQMNNSSKVPTNAATNITHNVNLSFEIGTTHVNPTENNGTTIEDVTDAKNSSRPNDTNESDHEDINDGALARALTDEGNGKS